MKTSSSAAVPHAGPDMRQFGLAALMLIMLWIAAGLGLARIALLLGVVYYVATLPALARTCRHVRQGKRTGQSVRNTTLVTTFLHSTKMVLMLFVTERRRGAECVPGRLHLVPCDCDEGKPAPDPRFLRSGLPLGSADAMGLLVHPTPYRDGPSRMHSPNVPAISSLANGCPDLQPDFSHTTARIAGCDLDSAHGLRSAWSLGQADAAGARPLCGLDRKPHCR